MNSLPKQFCVFDPKSNDLVCMNCSLKSDVDYVKLKELFDQLYAVKMDSSYCFGGKSEFGEGKNIVSLRDELTKMIKNSESLSFEGIYRLFESDEQRQNLKLASIIFQFMNLFSFDVLERYTSDYMLAVQKLLNSKSSNFFKANPTFGNQYRNAYYNTQMMMLSNFPLYCIMPEVREKKYYK